MRAKHSKTIKMIADACMTVLLLCLTAYQVTGEVLHEWFGIGMTVVLILHHILNRRWYAALFRGRYNVYRIVTTAINTLLFLSVALTALCGMSMSAHAVPFLYGMLPVSFARQFHLALSYWSFVLMGVHLGLHIPTMTALWNKKVKMILAVLCTAIAGVGLWLFIRSGITDYMFFRAPFAFFDYDRSAVLVFAENLAILTAFAAFGACAASLMKAIGTKGKRTEKILLPVGCLAAALLIGLALSLFVVEKPQSAPSWTAPADEIVGTSVPRSTAPTVSSAQADQHNGARPALLHRPESIGEYDVILLGYPNWWASIPMPVATFLEAYDFSGKTIVPFCSHGGGRFGQSITAIAKLAPDALLGEGLSIHYSGGASMASDVTAWLEANGIQ